MILNLSHKASRVVAEALQQYLDNMPDVDAQDLSATEIENAIIVAVVLEQIEDDLLKTLGV